MHGIGAAYAEGRERLSALVVGLSDEEAATTVPGCPEWSVADVIAHLAGVCADVVAGNIEGVATDPWTDAQVKARRGRPIADIVAEWSEVGPQVEAFADHFPGRTGEQIILDLTSHEHDVRGALGRPGARESTGVDIAVNLLVTLGLHASVTSRELAPLEVRSGDRRWVVGTGGASIDEEAAGAAMYTGAPLPEPGEPAGSVQVDGFELFRALTGRRSADQIRQWDWSVDAEPYVAAFQWGPFTTSPADVLESA